MIDIYFDFTTDSPGYWDGFWERNSGLGAGGSDPDNASPILQNYHKELWSKPLPNGEVMDLQSGSGPHYLSWKDFRFGSDSIIATFRYKKYMNMIEQVKNKVGDYKSYFEEIIRKSYTIGGMIIFPKHHSSMNQNRGTDPYISDRWDLTLECIRRYYNGQTSPLYDTIKADCKFYDLFVDFKGYVDFFFLQDMVADDYSKINIWCGDVSFKESGLPKTIDDYFMFIEKEFDFLEKRNARIKSYCDLIRT